jgi:hypothetical protein
MRCFISILLISERFSFSKKAATSTGTWHSTDAVLSLSDSS